MARRRKRAPAREIARGSEQRHILDVKIRSHVANRRRNARLGRALLGLGVLAALVGGLWWAVREGLRRGLWEHPDYVIREIAIDGNGRMTREEILDAAGLAEGQRTFEIDIAEVRRRLVAMPRVESASVVRWLPGRIEIFMKTRQAVVGVAPTGAPAGASAIADCWMADASGALFTESDPARENGALPVLYGCPERPLRPGETLSSPESRAALELLDALRCSPLASRVSPSWIDVSKGFCMELMDRSGRRFVFGLESLDLQLGRLAALVAHCEENRLELAEANLMVVRNIPVRMRGDPPPVARATPATPAAPGAATQHPEVRQAVRMIPPAPALSPAPVGARPEARAGTGIDWMAVASGKVPVRRAEAVKSSRERR